MEIALLGNPNTGKTSLFNQLTGTYAYTGNWSGVTIEKKVGHIKKSNNILIDLPGLYSINPISKDESVVTNYFLKEKCDQMVNVVDASQLERNLHLTLQMIESNVPMIIALNMVDVAKNRGIYINIEKLSKRLHSPVFPVIARTGEGCKELVDAANTPQDKHVHRFVDYGPEFDKVVEKLATLLPDEHSPRWFALQILEKNKEVVHYLRDMIGRHDVGLIIDEFNKAISAKYGEKASTYLYDCRSKAIEVIISDSVTFSKDVKETGTEKIDRIVTHPVLGIPIFFGLMYLMFYLTFDWLGSPLSDLLDGFINGTLVDLTEKAMNSLGASDFIHSLVVDGIFAGVGGVLIFVPQIFILFAFISLLEDSGYMARVAYVMDRALEKVGLNGKSFISMIIGFGCNVPGIMAARSIETPKERLLTVLLTPLMSCSARLPVYALFVGAFFSKNQGSVVFGIYILGIVMALILAKIFSMTIVKGETSFFVIELPPYRVPQAFSILKSTWDKGKGFVKKAGTFIFAGSVFVWVLVNLGSRGWGVEMSDSYFAAIGKFIAPIFKPIGFGTWEAAASLLTGVLAKEAVVSTMNVIYEAPTDAALTGAISNLFTPLSAISFMVFTLMYIPCLATIATIYKETYSKKWTAFSIGYALVVSYALCFVIYQVGSLLGY
ncbi:MAG: ferrous iron transport protein [Bacillales bacterium]|jgi:ferrous iron transport protein B|nr:ferrous iron transport protein [Bacillales bacterium]